MIQNNCLKLHKVAIVSKVGSKDSEQAAKDVTKKILAKKSTVFTISPIEVEGAKQIDTLKQTIDCSFQRGRIQLMPHEA